MLSPEENKEFIGIVGRQGEPEERMMLAAEDPRLRKACQDYLEAIVQAVYGDDYTSEGESLPDAVEIIGEIKSVIMREYNLSESEYQTAQAFCSDSITRA